MFQMLLIWNQCLKIVQFLIKIYQKWDVSNVTNMNRMFLGCISLKQNLSKWNISKVKNNNLMLSKQKPIIPGQKRNYSNKSSIYNNLNIPNNYKPKKKI